MMHCIYTLFWKDSFVHCLYHFQKISLILSTNIEVTSSQAFPLLFFQTISLSYRRREKLNKSIETTLNHRPSHKKHELQIYQAQCPHDSDLLRRRILHISLSNPMAVTRRQNAITTDLSVRLDKKSQILCFPRGKFSHRVQIRPDRKFGLRRRRRRRR